MTLDTFFPAYQKPRADSEIFVEERCANPKCRKILKITDPKYTLSLKGKTEVFCQTCGRARLPKKQGEKENENV